jgi:hypothetical protein
MSIEGVRKIEIPFTNQTQPIGKSVPHHQMLKKHIKDVGLEMGSLKTVIEDIFPKSIIDAFGGCGFSAAILNHTFPKAKLYLNDLDPTCSEVLKKNFPKAIVRNEDIVTWDFPNVDLVWIDFNNFTLKRLSQWTDVLIKAGNRSKILMFTDSACYGFKMGNLKAYEVSTPLNYYILLSQHLYPITKKYIRMVSMFGPAAVVRMENENGPIQMKNGVSPIKVHQIKKEGLFTT